MKKLVTSYTFDASAQTIVSADFTSLESIQLITNVTDNIIIYNFADVAKGGALAGTTLTLDFNTTAMDDTDKLQIFVDVATEVLPTGAATAAKQDTGNTSVASIDTKTPALGQALAAGSVPVILPSATITTLTPPAAITGFATATKQDTGNTSLSSIDGKITAVNTGAVVLAAGTAAFGKLSANSGVDIGDVDVTSLPALPAGNNNIGDVDVASLPVAFDTGTRSATTQRVTVATNDLVSIQGGDAEGAATNVNPLPTGLEGRDLIGTPVANGRLVMMAGNRNGHTYVTAFPPTHVSSNGTPITATTTSVIAAPSAGNHIRVTRIHISNGGATPCWVAVRDGAAGTRHYNTMLPQYGVISLNLNASGYLELTTATRLDIYMSAAGSVEYEIDYYTVND